MGANGGGRLACVGLGLAVLLLAPWAARAEDPRPAQQAPAASPPGDDDPVPPDADAPAEGDARRDDASASAPAPKKGPSTGTVTEELTVDKPDSTPETPRGSAGASNHLAASFNLGETWAVDASFDYNATLGGVITGNPFPSQDTRATTFGFGADWDPTDHFSLGAQLGYSPKSTAISGTTLDYDPPGTATSTILFAKLRADSSAATAGLSFTYDTAGESDLEWTFTLGLTGTQLDSTQVVSEVQLANGKDITKNGLAQYCTNFPKLCPKTLKSALKERAYMLDSAQLSAGVTATIFEDTDLGVTVDHWLYDQDPAELGYFSLTGAKSGVSGGGGVPIAPMSSDVRVELVHRFGAFSVKLNGTVGGYVDGTGGGTYGGGLKLQHKFSKAFRLWLTLSSRHDVDDAGAASSSRSGALGAALRF